MQFANGVKIYVIDSFYSGTNLLDVAYTAIAQENGSRVSYGAMIPFFFESIYWAHEIGHICGLDDIYHDVNSLLTYSGPFVPPQTNSVAIIDTPYDYSAYEEPELRRYDVIPRLLMCGYTLTEQERLNHTDIPIGSIRGLANDNNGSFIEQIVNVGLQSLNRHPSCKQR